MLAELALRLLTPAGRMTRRLGLVGESAALWARGLRQRRAWAPHHARCPAVVAAVIDELPSHRTVVVLGSGLVRDVPLALLRERFARVLLVDAVHLPQIRLRMLAYPTVTLLTRDLSGAMDWLAGERSGRIDPVADLVADSTIDLVISANLLSQLAWPVKTGSRRIRPALRQCQPTCRGAASPGISKTSERFVGRVCLISDVEMIARDSGGRIVERLDLMRGIEVPPEDESWDWPVAPAGEEADDLATVHRVCAWRNLNTRPAPL